MKPFIKIREIAPILEKRWHTTYTTVGVNIRIVCEEGNTTREYNIPISVKKDLLILRTLIEDALAEVEL